MKNIFILTFCAFFSLTSLAQQNKYVFPPAATQKTPGKSNYFTWISHTNEGPAMSQLLAEINFFQWLKDNYGMKLDIFLIDAGLFDGRLFYSSFNSERFKKKYPEGLDPLKEPLNNLGAGLGIWGGPDGFGNTEEEKEERIQMFLRLAKDYNLSLYKCDAVCGTLRKEHEDDFVDLWKKLREINPHLYFLNERLDLGKGESVSTTHLFESLETYIDVMMINKVTAPHHRVEAISRLNFPDNNRLLEDHGVCISSCLDHWEDDLILQAFARNSVLSPQIYGNPWLLSDDEFPRLAQIFNLHEKYRDILVDAIPLPGSKYGFQAVSRGNSQTRFLVLRNLTWDFEERFIDIGKEIGLPDKGNFEVRLYHPYGKILGTYRSGETVSITIPPFSTVLTGIFAGSPGLGISGAGYEVISDVAGKPVLIDILAYPGEECQIALTNASGYSDAKIDGTDANDLIKGKTVKVNFSGIKPQYPYHRKLLTLKESALSEDARAFYEATCYTASNNALEVQSLNRSGPSSFDKVNKARHEFFNQQVFITRSAWDKYLFDDDMNTGFSPSQRRTFRQPDQIATSVNQGAFRLDLGTECLVDSIILLTDSYYGLQPCVVDEGNYFFYSNDLKTWKSGVFISSLCNKLVIPKGEKLRYIYLPLAPNRLVEVVGYVNGEKLNRENWTVTNLFSDFYKMHFTRSWRGEVEIKEVTSTSYLAVALNGIHGIEGAYAALKVDGKYYGAYGRAPSFSANVWENYVMSTDRNYTYFLPLLEEFEGKVASIVVVGTDQCRDLNIEVWQTAYPVPFQRKRLVLTKK